VVLAATLPMRLHVLAQNRMHFSIVGQDSGHVTLGLAIR
jgi:hypothetical protein